MATRNPSEPRHDIIMFGDGLTALLDHRRDYIDKDGRRLSELTIYPGRAMRNFYNMKTTDLDSYGRITRTFFSEYIIQLNQSPGAKMFLCLCTFDWDDTVLTNLVFNQIIRETTDNTIITSLKIENLRLRNRITEILQSYERMISQNTRVIKKILQARGDYTRGLEENPEDMNQGYIPTTGGEGI